jgi:hypothetical protein
MTNLFSFELSLQFSVFCISSEKSVALFDACPNWTEAKESFG